MRAERVGGGGGFLRGSLGERRRQREHEAAWQRRGREAKGVGCVDVGEGGPWIARDDEEFERRVAQEHASAHDLCLALRWHRASIAETLPVVDDDGDGERMAEVRQVLSALGRAREALVGYYHLSSADATEDDPYARGEPPRLHSRAEGCIVLDRDSLSPRGTSLTRQQWAVQQLMALLDRHEAPPAPRRRSGLLARLLGRDG